MTRARWKFGMAVALGLVWAGCGDDNPCDGVDGACVALQAGASTDEVLEAFVLAEPDMTIAFGSGTFHLDRTLTLEPVPGVTIRGAGIDETILSFADQDEGHGIFVGAGGDDLLVEDLTIQDSRSNGIEVRGTDGIVFRRIKVEWTTDPNEVDPEDLDHDSDQHIPFGRYAIYPTNCHNLLLEESVAKRASDAGIYVGSCTNAVLRNNLAEENVSGIQVENTLYADVHGNVSRNNVIGMLVHDLPDQQPNPNGDQARVYDNEFTDNNFVNFAMPFEITSQVPSGSGMFIMGRGNVEVFDNVIADNDSVNFGVVSYFLLDPSYPATDEYYPYPDEIHVHDNTLSGGGESPEVMRHGEIVPLGVMLSAVSSAAGEGRVPDMLYDGLVDPDVAADHPDDDNPMDICLGSEPDGSLANMGATQALVQQAFADEDPNLLTENLSTDDTPFRCSLDPLPAVELGR